MDLHRKPLSRNHWYSRLSAISLTAVNGLQAVEEDSKDLGLPPALS